MEVRRISYNTFSSFIEALLVIVLAYSIFASHGKFFIRPVENYNFPIIAGLVFLIYLRKLLIGKFTITKSEMSFTLLCISFLFIIWLGLAFSKAPTYGFGKIFALTNWVIIALLTSTIVVNHIKVFIKANIFFGALFCLLLIIYFGDPITYLRFASAQNIRLGIDEGGESVLLNPIWVSRYLSIFIISLIVGTVSGVRLNKAVLFLMIAIGLLYMISSGSRGPLIGLSLAVALYLILINKTKFLYIGVFAVSLAALVYLSFHSSSIFSADILERFSFTNESGLERVRMQKTMIDAIGKKSILIGNGTGESGFFLKGYDEIWYPHNIFIEIIFENGLLGMCLFLFFLYRVFFSYTKAINGSNIYFLILSTAFFLNTLVSGDLRANSYFFVFCIWLYFAKLGYKKTSPQVIDTRKLNVNVVK